MIRRQPMSKLERGLLFPPYNKVPKSWRNSIEKEWEDSEGNGLGRNDRCPECGRLNGHFAGIVDEACICVKPERDTGRKVHYPYLAVPSFAEIEAKGDG